MLQIINVTLTHQNDLSKLTDKLSFTLSTGEKLGIIGEEGTGKSSLLQAIYQPNLISSYLDIEGQITNQFKKLAYLPQSLEKVSST